MSSYFSNIHISDTQISHMIHSSSHIYIYIYVYINAAVSCKRYPPSLPYIIIVQTCGKRWDLPKFVDVLSVNLGFSQSLIYNHHISPLQTPVFYTELILSRYVLTCFDIPSLTLDHLRSPAAPRFASPLPGVELRQWPLMARGLQALPGAALAAFGWRAVGGAALRQERLRISGRRTPRHRVWMNSHRIHVWICMVTLGVY